MKKLLSFSGGLDCFCLWWMLKDDPDLEWFHLPRNVHWGTQAVRALVDIPTSGLAGRGYSVASLSADECVTEDGGFILTAVAAGQLKPDLVYVGFNLDDNLPDSAALIAKEMELIASRCAGKRVDYEIPFEGMSKDQEVELALALGCPRELLLATWSCQKQHREPPHCGTCRNCLERRVAFVLNGLDDEFEQDPFEGDYAQALLRSEDPYGKRVALAIRSL